MADMEVQVSAQTLSAWKADLTLRCLLRAKFHRDKSRHSRDVISWAQSLVERISSAILREAGQQTAGFSIQTNMIQMIGSPSVVYICYDLFLGECDEQLRTKVSESFHMKRPIHYIIQKGKSFFMRRDERMDERVAKQYVDMSSIDKRPRPFFSDLQNPPFYDENGQHIENWEEAMAESPEESEQEGSEPERDALEKNRRAGI
jgi:hypothetical protein